MYPNTWVQSIIGYRGPVCVVYPSTTQPVSYMYQASRTADTPTTYVRILGLTMVSWWSSFSVRVKMCFFSSSWLSHSASSSRYKEYLVSSITWHQWRTNNTAEWLVWSSTRSDGPINHSLHTHGNKGPLQQSWWAEAIECNLNPITDPSPTKHCTGPQLPLGMPTVASGDLHLRPRCSHTAHIHTHSLT